MGSWACPWASRCLAYRALKGLEDCIPIVVTQPRMDTLDAAEAGEKGPDPQSFDSPSQFLLHAEENPRGWVIPRTPQEAVEGSTVDPWNNFRTLRQLYRTSQPDYEGRYSVPALWDLKTQTLVNNEVQIFCKISMMIFATTKYLCPGCVVGRYYTNAKQRVQCFCSLPGT